MNSERNHSSSFHSCWTLFLLFLFLVIIIVSYLLYQHGCIFIEHQRIIQIRVTSPYKWEPTCTRSIWQWKQIESYPPSLPYPYVLETGWISLPLPRLFNTIGWSIKPTSLPLSPLSPPLLVRSLDPPLASLLYVFLSSPSHPLILSFYHSLILLLPLQILLYSCLFLDAVASEGTVLFVVDSSLSNGRGVRITHRQFQWIARWLLL